MTYQEQLVEAIGAMIPEEKKEEFTAALVPVFESMARTFEKYDTDIRKLKEAKKAVPQQAPGEPGIDPREHEELQRKAEAFAEQVEALSGKERELQRKLNASDKKALEFAERLARESADLNATLLSNELRKAMGALSLAEGSGDEVFDILAKNVRVLSDEKGSRRIAAVVRDAAGVELERPLPDYVKGWAETSALAKRVLVAPRNSGTGGQGSQGSVGAPATLEAQYAEAMKRGDIATALGLKGKLAAELK